MPDGSDHWFITPRDVDASLKFHRDSMCWQVTNGWADKYGKRDAQLSGTRFFMTRDPDGNLIALNEMRQKS